MTDTKTPATLTDTMIRSLRDEAASAGDREQVELCNAALVGDRDAAKACAEAITDARAQDEDWDGVRVVADESALVSVTVDGGVLDARDAASGTWEGEEGLVEEVVIQRFFAIGLHCDDVQVHEDGTWATPAYEGED